MVGSADLDAFALVCSHLGPVPAHLHHHIFPPQFHYCHTKLAQAISNCFGKRLHQLSIIGVAVPRLCAKVVFQLTTSTRMPLCSSLLHHRSLSDSQGRT